MNLEGEGAEEEEDRNRDRVDSKMMSVANYVVVILPPGAFAIC